MENNLLHKDKVWNRVKNYIYFILFLVSVLIILLIVCIFLNCYIIKTIKYPTYTST